MKKTGGIILMALNAFMAGYFASTFSGGRLSKSFAMGVVYFSLSMSAYLYGYSGLSTVTSSAHGVAWVQRHKFLANVIFSAVSAVLFAVTLSWIGVL